MARTASHTTMFREMRKLADQADQARRTAAYAERRFSNRLDETAEFLGQSPEDTERIYREWCKAEDARIAEAAANGTTDEKPSKGKGKVEQPEIIG